MKSVTKKSTNVIGAALFAAAMALPSSHSAFAEAAGTWYRQFQIPELRRQSARCEKNWN